MPQVDNADTQTAPTPLFSTLLSRFGIVAAPEQTSAIAEALNKREAPQTPADFAALRTFFLKAVSNLGTSEQIERVSDATLHPLILATLRMAA